MYYIYKIENKINNKKYIGLTNNWQRRKNRHFADLIANRHDNGFLQKEFNIFKLENFSFEIIHEEECGNDKISELEIKYIANYDSYYNGYNQNKGGNFGPSNGGSHLIKSDIFNICSALEFMSRPGQILSNMYDVSKTTISRIKKRENHCEIINEYYNLSLEKRKNIYNCMCENTNFINDKVHTTILKSKRKLSKEQVFMVLANEENERIVSLNKLSKLFNIKSDYTLYSLLKEKTYKDYSYDYKNLTTTEKEKIVSLLRNEQQKTL